MNSHSSERYVADSVPDCELPRASIELICYPVVQPALALDGLLEAPNHYFIAAQAPDRKGGAPELWLFVSLQPHRRASSEQKLPTPRAALRHHSLTTCTAVATAMTACQT
jgi:hypothetical protein